MHAGVIVIGGNIMGAMAANELARRADPLRAPVVVLEAGPLEERAPASATIVEAPTGVMRHALGDGARWLANFETHSGRGIGFGRPGLIDLRVDAAEPGTLDQIARELELENVTAGSFDRGRALFHPERLHTEVFGLGRTRGVITRPGTTVTDLEVTAEGVRLYTERAGDVYEWDATHVLITDPDAALRWVPELVPHLELEARVEAAFASPRFTSDFVPLGTVRGSVADLHDIASMATASDPLEEFFSGDSQLEYPHPAIRATDFDVYPNPLDGQVIVAASGRELDRAALARFSPLFARLESAAAVRTVHLARPSDDIPIVGTVQHTPRLFLAVGLGRRAAQLAAGLAPDLATLIHGNPVSAFDVEALSPARFV